MVTYWIWFSCQSIGNVSLGVTILVPCVVVRSCPVDIENLLWYLPSQEGRIYLISLSPMIDVPSGVCVCVKQFIAVHTIQVSDAVWSKYKWAEEMLYLKKGKKINKVFSVVYFFWGKKEINNSQDTTQVSLELKRYESYFIK